MKPWMQFLSALGFFGALIVIDWRQIDPLLTRAINYSTLWIGIACLVGVIGVFARTMVDGLLVDRTQSSNAESANPAPASPPVVE